MKFVGICSAVIALVFSIFGSSQGFAAKDKNGIEEKGIYNITMDIGGKPWAWTHVVPADRPKNLIGTNPKAEKVELKPLVKGEKSQQWKIRTEIEGKWIYHVYSMISAPQDNPHSPLSIIEINGKFENNDAFDEKFNIITVNTNQSEISRAWYIPKQGDKFYMQPLIGHKDHIKPDNLTFAFGEERVVEAVPKGDKVLLKYRVPSKAPNQLWTLKIAN